MPMRVDFVIAGVQKGGTTSLFEYLRQHPQIAMPEVKETHFFDNEAEFRQSEVDYERYHRFFRERRTDAIYGEATPIYTYWPAALPRLRAYNPAMKIIVLLRNPVQRAWSAWRMEKNRGADSLSFSEAIHCETERSKEALPFPHRVYSYVDRGFYAEQIRRAQRCFPRSVLFLKSETFFTDTEASVDRVLAFLGIAPHPIDTGSVHFEGLAEQGPDDSDHEYLLNRFDNDIASVETLLNWDCSDWRMR